MGSGSLLLGTHQKWLDANVDKQLRSLLRDSRTHFFQRDRSRCLRLPISAAIDRQDFARSEFLNIAQPRYAVCLPIENLADRAAIAFRIRPSQRPKKAWLAAKQFSRLCRSTKAFSSAAQREQNYRVSLPLVSVQRRTLACNRRFDAWSGAKV